MVYYKAISKGFWEGARIPVGKIIPMEKKFKPKDQPAWLEPCKPTEAELEVMSKPVSKTNPKGQAVAEAEVSVANLGRADVSNPGTVLFQAFDDSVGRAGCSAFNASLHKWAQPGEVGVNHVPDRDLPRRGSRCSPPT